MDYDSLVASYVCQVLQLHENDTEEALDERLRNEARLLGIGVEPLEPDHNVEQPTDVTAESASSVSTDTPRRSRESSRSIGALSIISIASKISNISLERRHARRQMRQHPNTASQSSFTSRSVKDVSIPRGRPDLRDLHCPSSLIAPSCSTFSFPAKSRQEPLKSQSRLIRGLSKLVMSRRSSHSSVCDTCSVSSDGTSKSCQSTQHLPCGHRICHQALRRLVKDSGRNGDVVMRCNCGEIIPQNVIEVAMNQLEDISAKRSSGAASIVSQRRDSTFTCPQSPVPRARVGSPNDGRTPPAHTSQTEPDVAIISRGDFTHMRRLQVEQRDRMLSWLEERRAEMGNRLKFVIDKSWQRYEHAVKELASEHDAAMSEAEDKQVKAEAKMRAAHEKSVRDHATALKYMEAYCAGTFTSGEPHHRVVTPQNLVELEKKRKTLDEIGPRHTSAINVLRGEQIGRIRDRAHRRDAALHDLHLAQQHQRDRCFQGHTQRMTDLDEFARDRRARIRRRWRLATAIYLKKIEDESQVCVRGRVPEVEWPPIEASSARNDSLLQSDSPRGI